MLFKLTLTPFRGWRNGLPELAETRRLATVPSGGVDEENNGPDGHSMDNADPAPRKSWGLDLTKSLSLVR